MHSMLFEFREQVYIVRGSNGRVWGISRAVAIYPLCPAHNCWSPQTKGYSELQTAANRSLVLLLDHAQFTATNTNTVRHSHHLYPLRSILSKLMSSQHSSILYLQKIVINNYSSAYKLRVNICPHQIIGIATRWLSIHSQIISISIIRMKIIICCIKQIYSLC